MPISNQEHIVNEKMAFLGEASFEKEGSVGSNPTPRTLHTQLFRVFSTKTPLPPRASFNL